MFTAEELNYLRDLAYRENPVHANDAYGPTYSNENGDTLPGRGDWQDSPPHGNPDPTIRIRGYFAEGDIEQGLAMVVSMLNLRGAAASEAGRQPGGN